MELSIAYPTPLLREVTLTIDEEEAAFLTDLLGKCTGSIAYELYSPLSDLDEKVSLHRRFNLDNLPTVNIHDLEPA